MVAPSIETNNYKFYNQTTLTANTMNIGVPDASFSMLNGVLNTINLGNTTNTKVKFGNQMTIINGFIDQLLI